MTKIILKQAQFSCKIGLTAAERRIPQPIMVDLTVSVAAPTFVNYSHLHQTLQQIVNSSHVQLIETLAENIASGLLTDFPIKTIRVRVIKPQALADKHVPYTAVEITKSSHE